MDDPAVNGNVNGGFPDKSELQSRLMAGGLQPVRRIYRNYAWVIFLAVLLSLVWCYFSYKNYYDRLGKEYFNEFHLLEALSISMMIDEHAESLPAYERWLIGVEDKQKSRLRAVEHLEYADDRGLLTQQGLIMLVCAHWSLGNTAKVESLRSRVSGLNTYRGEALLSLLEGDRVSEQARRYLVGQLGESPRDWTVCFLTEKVALSETDDAMMELVRARRQMLLVGYAKTMLVRWVVFALGVWSLFFLFRKRFSLRRQQGKVVPRLPHLWPLTFVLIVFVIGDFASELLTEVLWLFYPVISAVARWSSALEDIVYMGYVLLSDMIFRAFGMMLFLWFFLRRFSYIRRTLLKPVPHFWQWTLAVWAVLWVMDWGVYSLPETWFPFDATLGCQWREYGWLGLVTGVFSAVVLAPVCEEFVFRGLLFNGFKNRLGVHAAAILSSVIFTVVHFYGVQSLLSVCLFGVVMAYVYHMTKSLRICIMVHALTNLIITVSNWYLCSSPEVFWKLE